VLGLETRELEKRLAQRRYFAWIKRKVTPDEVAAVRALDLPGVAFTREPRRFYPNRTLAATVMGQSGVDGRGLDGVELAFDSYLRGSASSVQGVRDALGRELFVDAATDTANGTGSDVVLTLDRYLTSSPSARSPTRPRAITPSRWSASCWIRHRRDPGDGVGAVVQPQRSGSAAEGATRNRAITTPSSPGRP